MSMAPFDVYFVDREFYVDKYPLTLGFNGAGNIANVGTGVNGLKIGDRAENFVPKIPNTLPLAEAATISVHFVTAFYTLFNQLGLPVTLPFPAIESPPLATTPTLIYRAGLAGYKEIISIASQNHYGYLYSLGVMDTFDYRSSTLVEANGLASRAEAIMLASITAKSTLNIVVVHHLAKAALLLLVKEGNFVTNTEDQNLYIEISGEQSPFACITASLIFLFRQDEYLNNLTPKIRPSLLVSWDIKPNHVRLLDQGILEEMD
ncbi:hypothetical protein CVT25_011741 [Psilocybe cyanescens]|uniref:Alcohol dehydrogenase-like N-terminal domain-containing protein n=1 Tax=Psilocybe cyanescens TaxID=93625 RepID=A0A409WIE8_PSICY|nr:hypothetical protein CVT25_011741 [Psilocybe cyanescens]